MSSFQSSLPFQLPAGALPTLVGLLSVTGIMGGAYNFASPLEGAKTFGLVPASSPSTPLSPFEKAYIRVHGIRNIGGSLTNLGLLSYWAFSTTCKTDPVAAATVLRMIGLGMVLGTVVAVGDAWILKQYAQEVEASPAGAGAGANEAVATARAKGTGHAITAGFICAVGLLLVA